MTHTNRLGRSFGSRTRFTSFVCVGLVGLLGLVGCADDSKKSSTTAPSAESGGGDTSGGNGSLGGGDASGGSTEGTTPANPRKLVIKMTVGIEVANVANAVNKVIALAESHGGALYDSNVDLSDPAYAGGDLVFKVPPEEVDAFVQGLSPAIGRQTALQGTTSDVTDQLADLDSQIKTARASVDRVRALMDQATKLADVVTLEGELTTRETKLEQLLAQQSNIEHEVAMATITVHLTTAPADAAKGKPATTVSKAFHDGWHAFVSVLRALVLFVGYTLPFLVIAGIGLLVWWRFFRRRIAPGTTAGSSPRGDTNP